MKVSRQLYVPAASSQQKLFRYPYDNGLGGPNSEYEDMKKRKKNPDKLTVVSPFNGS
jgi:hypothetical protein